MTCDVCDQQAKYQCRICGHRCCDEHKIRHEMDMMYATYPQWIDLCKLSGTVVNVTKEEKQT